MLSRGTPLASGQNLTRRSKIVLPDGWPRLTDSPDGRSRVLRLRLATPAYSVPFGANGWIAPFSSMSLYAR